LEQTYYGGLRKIPSRSDVRLPETENTGICLCNGDTVDLDLDLASCGEDIDAVVGVLGVVEDW